LIAKFSFLNNQFKLVTLTKNNIPITPNDDNAKVYNIPKLKSAKQRPCPKGIIAQPKKLSIKVAIGATKNNTLFA
jgi:hypothetical protein